MATKVHIYEGLSFIKMKLFCVSLFLSFLVGLCAFAADQRCLAKINGANEDYRREVALAESRRSVAADNEDKAFKSAVNSLYFRHKNGHTPESVYQKNADMARIKHNSVIRSIEREYSDKMKSLNDTLTARLRAVQAGDCD